MQAYRKNGFQRDQRDSTKGEALTLHIMYQGSIPGIPYGSHTGMISEYYWVWPTNKQINKNEAKTLGILEKGEEKF